MSSVKINNKDRLDRLAAKILLKTGKKYTQQELLSLCVQIAEEDIDEFIKKIVKRQKIWTKEEIEKLKKRITTDLGEGTENLSQQVDEILYGDE